MASQSGRRGIEVGEGRLLSALTNRGRDQRDGDHLTLLLVITGSSRLGLDTPCLAWFQWPDTMEGQKNQSAVLYTTPRCGYTEMKPHTTPRVSSL